MKKLTLTIAIILTMGLCASAQSLLQREEQQFRDGPDITTPVILPDAHGTGTDAEATPLGSGIAMLVGFGAAYMVGKKRKED